MNRLAIEAAEKANLYFKAASEIQESTRDWGEKHEHGSTKSGKEHLPVKTEFPKLPSRLKLIAYSLSVFSKSLGGLSVNLEVGRVEHRFDPLSGEKTVMYRDHSA
jgi:hypothetical protein